MRGCGDGSGGGDGGGFTVLELLVVLGLVSVLVGLTFAGIGKIRSQAQGVTCANSLRQLGVATQLYLAEHRQVFFRYKEGVPGVGVRWYFGLEPLSSIGHAEGDRTLDVAQGPLGPYLEMTRGVQVCPAFPFQDALSKPKFQGASFGYGFNMLLDGKNALQVEDPSRVLIFGDCAQVNNFQAPASASHPMVEEFYMIEQTMRTIHFRHGTRAQFVFLDGHVERLPMCPGTRDSRLPSTNIGRITPVGSKEYLQ